MDRKFSQIGRGIQHEMVEVNYKLDLLLKYHESVSQKSSPVASTSNLAGQFNTDQSGPVSDQFAPQPQAPTQQPSSETPTSDFVPPLKKVNSFNLLLQLIQC